MLEPNINTGKSILVAYLDMFKAGFKETSAAFEIVDHLASSAQNVVHMICESISSRTPGLSDRTKKQAATPNLWVCFYLVPYFGLLTLKPYRTELMLFDFLEKYSKQLENPLALQVWGRFMQLTKDLVASLREFKVQAFSTLR